PGRPSCFTKRPVLRFQVPAHRVSTGHPRERTASANLRMHEVLDGPRLVLRVVGGGCSRDPLGDALTHVLNRLTLEQGVHAAVIELDPDILSHRPSSA